MSNTLLSCLDTMAAIVHQDCLCMVVTGDYWLDKYYKACYRIWRFLLRLQIIPGEQSP